MRRRKVIEIDQLSFDYRTFSKEPGLKGALQDIFHRKYQLVPALKDLNLTIKDGEIIGLIGPNGAGKTTLTKLLTGIIQPSSGSVKVAGLIPGSRQKKLLRQIGVMFGQKSQLSWNLPAVDTLNMLAAIYQLKPDHYQARLRELCDLLDIGEIVKTPVRKLSLGQRIRCELACSLIHEPSYLLRQIGVMFGQKSQLSWNLPAVDTLNMLAAIYQLKPDHYQARLRELCDLLDIGEIVKTPVRKLSLGQRIRCELACSLIHEPSYLFLDEPTIGLDLLTQEKIYNFLKTENRLHQTTIILTSHNVRDIEALAQRLLILSKGELIFNDSLNKLPLQIDQSDSYCLKYWINDQTDVREEIIHDPQQLFVKMEKFQPEQIISLSKSGISAEEVILKIYQREKQ